MNGTNSDQVEALNNILSGEQMAINIYNIFLNKIDDPNLKETLSNYKKDHEEHAALLSNRIRELGEEPKEGSGTAQVMSQLMSKAQTMVDLYYRLITFEIRVPPLRERPEDIEPLTKFFLKELCRRMEKPVPHWTPEFMAALLSRPWWGNVRELRSALEHALILCRGGLLHPDLLPPPLPQASSQVTAVASNLQDCVRQWTQDVLKTGQAVGHIHQEFLDIVEPVLFETVLQHYGGQYVNAARALGIHRVTLRRKMDRVKRSESGQQWFR